jgi:hypothetical protein
MNLSLSERKPTAEDLIYEEAARAWREEGPEFKRLKRLALDLGIAKVIVTPERTHSLDKPQSRAKRKSVSNQSQRGD